MKKTGIFAISMTAALFAVSGSAQAGMLGAPVTSQYYAYGGPINAFGSPASFVANGTVQQTFCGACLIEGFDLTVSDTQIQYTFLLNGYWSPSAPSLNSGGLFIANGNLLTFSGLTITGVTLDASTNMPGFNAGKVTFNASSVAVDWAGLSGISSGDKVILNVVAMPVPEPETYALMLAGLGLPVLVARRRKQQAV